MPEARDYGATDLLLTSAQTGEGFYIDAGENLRPAEQLDAPENTRMERAVGLEACRQAVGISIIWVDDRATFHLDGPDGDNPHTIVLPHCDLRLEGSPIQTI